MTGRRYLLSKLSINGVFRCLSANADPVEHVVRLVIYIDKQSLAASGSSQFGNLNSIYLEPTDTRNRVNTFQNLDVSERFVILRDKRWAFRPTANVSSTEPIDVSIPFEYHFDLKRRRMEVEVGTNGAGTPTNYSLNIGAVTSGGTVTVDYFARVMFFDEDV